MTINFSVIIPNYNGSKFISSCLKSLGIAISNCPQSQFEIILVDNASADNSLQVFKRYFKGRIIQNQQNLGFSAAVNLGIKASKHKYVCILNNDLTLDEYWFKLISKTIKNNREVATFCGTVLNQDGSLIESQGLKFYYSGKCQNINNGHRFLKIKNHKLKTSFVWGASAAAVVYKKENIQAVGLFDESFFAYIEDVDLSFRLTKNNQLTLLQPAAISYHLGGQTSSAMGNLRAKYTFINWIKLILKNFTFREIVLNLPFILVERLRNLSYYLRCSFIIGKL